MPREMEFIKEYQEEAEIVVIRFRAYGSSLSTFVKALEVAKQDGFEIEDARIVHYGGRRYSGTFGIEFSYPDAPKEYTRIQSLEFYK